ncbi:MAG TPA: ABC transporter permease, partial [Ardenticatenaceae bacterium]|nr:ABC transporter permease [Ardenticatenaceae bacterium]
ARGPVLIAPPPGIARPARPAWLDFWLRFSRNFFAVLGLVMILGFIAVGLVGPFIAPYSYREQFIAPPEQSPSFQHLLGTDHLGRDQFSRMLHATRTALVVAPAVVVVALTLGLFLGLLAGFYGGWVDALIMRIGDLLFAIPGLLLPLLRASTIGPRFEEFFRQFRWARGLVQSGWPEFFVVVTALSLVGWAGLARLIRGQVLALRETAFVEAAEALGVPPRRILFRHILPNAIVPVVVAISMGLGGAILAESTLSFLGIGIQPPTPSFGAMIQEAMGLGYWRKAQAPWLVWAPGLVVAAMVFAFNFLGDGLNEALNPHRDRGK